jgi:tetratricopeptide (TPR) repeat protein
MSRRRKADSSGGARSSKPRENAAAAAGREPAAHESAALEPGGMLFAYESRSLWLAGIVVVLATVFLYWPALQAGFVDFDDGQYVANNPRVVHPSLSGAIAFFTEVRAPTTVAGYYQPLTMASLMVDSAMGGKVVDAYFGPGVPDPSPFHRTNVLLHALNAVLVMLIARRACGGVVAPALAAMVFAMHPIQVESVMWISQRKTVLATAFALMSVWCYLRGAEPDDAGRNRSKVWYIAALAAYALAMLAKPTALLLPFVLLMLDVWPLRRFSLRRVGPMVPFFAVAALGGWIAAVSQTNTVGLGVVSIDSLSKAATMAGIVAYNIAMYARNIVWPSDLNLIYPLPAMSAFSQASVWGVAAAGLVIMAAWIASFRVSRPVFVGVGSALLLVGVALGPVQFMQSSIGDRFVYLPLALLVLPLAQGLSRFLSGANKSESESESRRPPTAATSRGGGRTIVLTATAVAIALLARQTMQQQGMWWSPELLWTHVLDAHPDNALANSGLAKVYARNGQQLIASGRLGDGIASLEEAVRRMSRAVDAEPGDGAHRRDRADFLIDLRRYDEAVADAEKAAALEGGPDVLGFGIVLARAYAFAGRPDDARSVLQRMEQAGRSEVDARKRVPVYEWIAVSLAASKRWNEALPAYQRAVEVFTEHKLPHVPLSLGLAKVLVELGQANEAEPIFADPDVQRMFPAECDRGLAAVAVARGAADLAMEHLRRAVARDPALADMLPQLRVFEPLHGHPGWPALLERRPRGMES